MTHEELVAASEKWLKALLRRRLPTTRTFLFGSRARGSAGRAADFDILINGDVSLQLLGELHDEIEESFVPFGVDFVLRSALRGPILEEVNRDATPWT